MDDKELSNHIKFLLSVIISPKDELSPSYISTYFQLDQDVLIALADDNRILYTLLHRLLTLPDNTLGNEERKTIELLDEYIRRASTALSLICNIQEALTNSGIGFSTFKTFDDYPNIPSRDIDIVINKEDLERAKKAILEIDIKPLTYEKGTLAYLGESTEKRYFYYRINGFEFEVELYPGLTVLGEKYLTSKEIIQNARSLEIAEHKIQIPSPEDALIIIVVHSFYKHGGLIRICDISSGIRLIKNNHLDWQYIFDTAQRRGLTPALYSFLALVDGLHKKLLRQNLLPRTIAAKIGSNSFTQHLEMKHVPYRLPVIFLASIFLYKIVADAFSLQFLSTLKSFQTGFFKISGRVLGLILELTHKSIVSWGIGVTPSIEIKRLTDLYTE